MNPEVQRRAERARTAVATDVSDVYVYRTNVNNIDRTEEVADGVIIDFDPDGNVIGVEVLDAVRTVVSARVPFENDT